MSEPRDFHEIVGDDLSPEDVEELRRVDAILRSVPPPVEVPASLTRAVAGLPLEARGWTRRRLAAVAALAAVASTLFFALGHWAAGDGLDPRLTVAMRPTANAPQASAEIRVGERDAESGNWQLELDVSGLPKLPGDRYYILWLGQNGQYAATCGTFNVSSGGTTVRMTVSYRLQNYDTWVITEHSQNEAPWLLTAPIRA